MFLIHSLRKGGAEKLLLQIANYLNEKGYDIRIVQIVNCEEYDEYKFSKLSKIYLIEEEAYKWPIVIPKIIKKLKKASNKFNPDLICIFSPILVIVTAIAGLRTGIIHVIQGYGSVCRGKSLKDKVYKFLDKLALYLTKYKVIVPTESLKKAFLQYTQAKDTTVQVIPSGIDSESLKFNDKYVFNNKVNITMLGTVYKEKGQRHAVEIVKEFKSLYPNIDICVQIIGSGSDERYILNRIKSEKLEKNIKLLGRRDDAFELISDSNIFWHLSESEGMPLVVMEAMALGTPVIAFDVRGVNDVIQHNINGCLVEFGDTKAIAINTKNLVENKSMYEKLKSNARNNIDQKYTIKNMFNNYEHFLKNCYEIIKK